MSKTLLSNLSKTPRYICFIKIAEICKKYNIKCKYTPSGYFGRIYDSVEVFDKDLEGTYIVISANSIEKLLFNSNFEENLQIYELKKLVSNFEDTICFVVEELFPADLCNTSILDFRTDPASLNF